ncbi:MAG: NADP-dependent malic enzyme [Anaerolineae bacterium]|nr:NADP-dependent malic enzyme [Anaerolineae bacterium]
MTTKEELLAKATKPAADAMRAHPFYQGKVQIAPKVPVRDVSDFAIWYTPGVAAPCRDIAANPAMSWEHTNRGNTIAVVSDGTRVLGLGDIGPEAAMPVMEGKALLFKYLGGVDAVPLCLDTRDPDLFIQAVKLLQPSFGGINLEDIAKPKCFRILDTLRAEMEIPVWHDDQQGTAAVTLAGLVNALKVVGKALDNVTIAMIGAGAANVAILRLVLAAGADPARVMMVDTKGILHRGRDDFDPDDPRAEFARVTNGEGRQGGIPEALRGADACIALSRPGPDTLRGEWLRAMASDAILFACANPIPEIWPWEASEAGVRVVATGRSDFPNQVNNSLGFPGIFRGVLDVRARTISDEMAIAAAYEIARCAEEVGLSETYIMPTMDEWEVFPREAVATALKAQEQGLARLTKTRDELYAEAKHKIAEARTMLDMMMGEGMIAEMPV